MASDQHESRQLGVDLEAIERGDLPSPASNVTSDAQGSEASVRVSRTVSPRSLATRSAFTAFTRWSVTASRMPARAAVRMGEQSQSAISPA
jgi:hypothetical protein